MRRTFKLKTSTLSIFTFVFLISCGIYDNDYSYGAPENEGKFDYNPENWVAKYNSESLCGYVDQYDNVMIDYQFEHCRSFENGKAQVSKIGQPKEYFFIDTSGTIISDGFKYISHTPEGFPDIAHCFTRSKGRYLIDSSGTRVSDFYHDIYFKTEAKVFVFEKTCDSCTTSNTLSAFTNASGNIVSDWYPSFQSFVETPFFIAKKGNSSNNLSAAINPNGEVISEWYSSIYTIKNLPEYFTIADPKNDGWNTSGIMNSQGEMVVPMAYNKFEVIKDLDIIVATSYTEKHNKIYTVFSLNCKQLTKSAVLPIYFPQNIEMFAVAFSKAEYAYYKIVAGELFQIGPNYQLPSKWVTSSGYNPITRGYRGGSSKKLMYWIPTFSDGFAAVKLNDKFGFINANGELVIDYKYSKTEWFRDGLCTVVYKGKEITIDKEGNHIQ